MNLSPSFNNIRSFTAYKFSRLRMQAMRDSFWAHLTGRNTKLAVFPEHEQRNNSNRRLLGLKDIPVEQIIGTFNRQNDFDYRFRPMRKDLCDRWINTQIALARDRWSPILAHKVGEAYYVEDGHHRVSVARASGMAFIEAEVWEYSSQQKQTGACPTIRCVQKNSVGAYATR